MAAVHVAKNFEEEEAKMFFSDWLTCKTQTTYGLFQELDIYPGRPTTVFARSDAALD